MADNLQITPGSGPAVAADGSSGAYYQRVKMTVGDEGAVAPVTGFIVGSVASQAVTEADPVTLNPARVTVAGQRNANTEGLRLTVSGAVIGFTPVATATDFLAILGSAGKIQRITRISVSGIATAATVVDLVLLKRSTLDTGGTPTPVTLVKHSSADGASLGVVVDTYAANPTLGTLVGNVRAAKLGLGTTSAPGAPVTWDFTTRNGEGLQLHAATEMYALNWNGAVVPAGTLLDIDIELTESTD